MAKQNNPKLNHFIPQVMLRSFSPDGKNIYRFDKESSLIQYLPISKVAAIKNYYTMYQRNGKKDTSIENPFLSDIDNEYPKLLKHLEEQKPLEDIRESIVLLISAMFARVPKQRSNMERIADEINNFLWGGLKSHIIENVGIENTIKEYEKDTGKKITKEETDYIKEHLSSVQVKSSTGQLIQSMLVEMEVFMRVINNSFFWVGIVPEDASFITSDNPAGASFLPITPKMCLFSSRTKKPRDYVQTDKQVIEDINRIIFNTADQYLFSQDGDLVQVNANKGIIKKLG